MPPTVPLALSVRCDVLPPQVGPKMQLTQCYDAPNDKFTFGSSSSSSPAGPVTATSTTAAEKKNHPGAHAAAAAAAAAAGAAAAPGVWSDNGHGGVYPKRCMQVRVHHCTDWPLVCYTRSNR